MINEVRAGLGDQFDVDVDTVTEAQVDDAVDAVFADGDRAVNVAAMTAILERPRRGGRLPGIRRRRTDRSGTRRDDSRRPALRLLAEATFYYADIRTHGDPEDPDAGRDSTTWTPRWPPASRRACRGGPGAKHPSPFALESD